MAEAAVTFAVRMLKEAIERLKVEEHMNWTQVLQDLESMCRQLEKIGLHSRDADWRSYTGEEEAKKWVDEAVDTAHEACHLASEIQRTEKCKGEVKRSPGALALAPSRLESFKQLQRELYTLRDWSFFRTEIDDWRGHLTYESGKLVLDPREEGVVGFEEHTSKLMQLMRSGNQNKCSIIKIVGRSGMGKTTLAREVFKSAEKEFPIRIWLNFSQNSAKYYDCVDRFLIEILRQMMLRSKWRYLDGLDTKELGELVRMNLKEKRFLIVVDNLQERELLDYVSAQFSGTSQGCIIIIPTLNENVATDMDQKMECYSLKGLDLGNSLQIFYHSIYKEELFRKERYGISKITDDAIPRCGSPLTLDSLGSLVARTVEQGKLIEVVRKLDILRGVSKEDDIHLDILRLSYNELPAVLKWCFLSLSAFPDNYQIEAEKLIKLWVAEGFAENETVKGEERMEDVAWRYLEELKQRRLIGIQVGQEFNEENDAIHVRYCQVHNTVREFCIDEAKKARFMHREANDPRSVHRLSLRESSSLGLLSKDVSSTRNLRTLINFTQEKSLDFQSFTRLRVLDLEGADIDDLLEEVGGMSELRYLSIRNTLIWELPDSVGKLSKLQTLDCRDRIGRESFIPDGVWKIKTLRHVHGKSILCDVDISLLTDLQTLETVYLSEQIKNSLQSLKHLRVVRMHILPGLMTKSGINESDAWNHLQNLKFLQCLLLNLSRDTTMEMECLKSGFPRLSSLTLVNFDVEYWKVEKGSMPLLEFLALRSCPWLHVLPSGLLHCKKLQEVQCIDMGDEFYKKFSERQQKKTWNHFHVTCLPEKNPAEIKMMRKKNESAEKKVSSENMAWKRLSEEAHTRILPKMEAERTRILRKMPTAIKDQLKKLIVEYGQLIVPREECLLDQRLKWMENTIGFLASISGEHESSTGESSQRREILEKAHEIIDSGRDILKRSRGGVTHDDVDKFKQQVDCLQQLAINFLRSSDA